MMSTIQYFKNLPQDNPYQSGCDCLLVMHKFRSSMTKEAFLYNSASEEIDFYTTMVSLLIPEKSQTEETQTVAKSAQTKDKFSQLLPQSEIEQYHFEVYGSLHTSPESARWHQIAANRAFRDNTAKKCHDRVHKLLVNCAQKMYDIITARELCQGSPYELRPSTVIPFRKLANTLDTLMKQGVITAKYRNDEQVTATAYLQYLS